MSDERRADGRCDLLARLRHEWVQLGLLLFFALAVQLPKLGVAVGSPDEEGGPENVGAIQICQESLGQITTNFYKARNHPLFSIVAHFSVKYAPLPALVAARLPALFAGLLVPVVFYFTHRSWVGRQAALFVAYLLLLADPLHHYITAARGYSMLVLGTLLMNQLLLAYLERPRVGLVAAYGLVAAATAYTHLWALLIFVAHGVYLAAQSLRAMVSRARGEPSRVPAGRWFAALTALAVAAALALLLYLPMLADVLAMSRAQRASRIEAAFVLGDGLLQLARFRNWTLAAYVLLVPIVLEGFARKLRGGRPDKVFWFHVTVVVCASAAPLIAPPQNFDSRFLMPLIPSGASLIAWGLSGYWQGSGDPEGRVLPRAATWLAGFALGVLASNASMTVDIPVSAVVSHADASGADHGYFYRNLPKAVGSRAAGYLLGIAAAMVCLRRRLPSLPDRLRRGAEMLGLWLWSALLLFSLPPLALGPDYFQHLYGLPRWVFEVHLPATAVIGLLAWEHRWDAGALRRLRYGLLVTALVVVVWQLGGDRLQWDAWAPVRLLAIAPPALAVVSLAREES